MIHSKTIRQIGNFTFTDLTFVHDGEFYDHDDRIALAQFRDRCRRR